MFKSYWDWFLAIAIFVFLILMVGEIYSFYRDRRASAIFSAFSYLIFSIGLACYYSSSLWFRLVFGPIIFLFSVIMYWVSINARKDENAPRPIFMSKSKKEKEAEKQAKLTQQKKAEISASATIAAEKRATTRISPGTVKPGGTAASKASPTRSTRK
jgi:type VI protein secretion system component VasK